MKFKLKGAGGFSLVELMVVVGIIGILATLAMPKLQIFMAKAKQSEAKTQLGAVYTLQQAYYVENEAYGTAAVIGWSVPNNPTPRYDYTITGSSGTGFTAVATSKAILYTGAGSLDAWRIDETKALTNTLVGL